MTDTNTTAARIGVRLREALGGKPVQDFQQELEAAGVANSTYSSVYRYVKGRVVPPLDWLQSAALILGVPLAWLAFGDGERHRTVALTDSAPPIERAVFGHAVTIDLKGSRPLLGTFVDRVLDALPAEDRDAIDDDEIRDLLDELLCPIYRTWYALRGDTPVEKRDLEKYLAGALSNLMSAVAPPSSGRSLSDAIQVLRWGGDLDRDGIPKGVRITEGQTVGTIGAKVIAVRSQQTDDE